MYRTLFLNPNISTSVLSYKSWAAKRVTALDFAVKLPRAERFCQDIKQLIRVYWPFLSISLRRFWLWIHPCNTLLRQCEGPRSKLETAAKNRVREVKPSFARWNGTSTERNSGQAELQLHGSQGSADCPKLHHSTCKCCKNSHKPLEASKTTLFLMLTLRSRLLLTLN